MPDEVTTTTTESDPKPRPSRRRRWVRRALIVLIGLPLLLLGVVLIVGQTSAMKSFVEPILASQLGVDVKTGSIKLGADGTIMIRDAVFSSENIDGDAGDLIEIPRATIDIHWGGLISGGVQVSSIEIENPILRVSQDTQTGRVNLAEMKFESDGGGGATPAIELRGGTLEIGEHHDGQYEKLKTLSLMGRIERADGDGVSRFALVALPTEPGIRDPSSIAVGGVIKLDGQISPDGVTGQLDGVRLQDWPAAFVPSRSRGMYERLGLAGELAPTRLNINSDGEVEVTLTLDGVSLNLPIDERGTMTGSGNLLRMRQTRGTIAFGTRGLVADLNGLIDELEYDVELNYRGLDAQSPFDAVLSTEFRLDGQFRPAKFLPENVISKLERFDNPVADVDAVVQVERGQDQQIRVSGRAQLSNGSATYKKFSYRFNELEGVISFDPDKLVVERITGVGPTGATLHAEGLFSPLGEESVVELKLRVDGVPIDRYLLGALDEEQQELVGALFDEESYASLLSDGLLLQEQDREELTALRRVVWDRLDQWRDGVDGDRAQRDQLAAQLSAIDRKLSTPAFSFGGSANVDVVLRRHPERPSDNRWTTDVLVKLPRAGLVSGNFPLPIVAHDVEIMINEDRVELTGGRYSGLDGGTAQVTALIDRTKPDTKPTVTIRARGISIDDRLIAAIPGYYDEQSEDPDDISLRRILDRLRLGGNVDCDAIIGPRSDNRLGYDVEATISRGYARPVYQGTRALDDRFAVTPGSDPLALNELYGTVYVTEELIIVDLNGKLSSPEMPLAPTPISVLTQLTLPSKSRGLGGARREGGLLPTEFGPPIPGAEIFATARADGLDLAMPLHHAVAVVSPRIARDLLRHEAELSPDGVLAIDARLEGFVGGEIESAFMIDRIESLSFTLDDARYTLGASWGSASIDLSQTPSVAFDAFTVPIQTQGQDAGKLSLDGALPLARPGDLLELHDPSAMRITYERGMIDSAPVRLLIDRFASDRAKDWIVTNELQGRFDLDVTLTPESGVHRISSDANAYSAPPVAVHGTLEPLSLQLTMNEQTADFAQVQGHVLFEGYTGRFEQIRAVGDESSIALDGSWALLPRQGLNMDLRVDAQGDLLQGPVRAIIPEPVGRVIESLQIDAEGGVVIDGMRVVTEGLGTSSGLYELRGSARIEQGSAVLGLPITDLSGDLAFAVRGTQETLGYELRLQASRLRAGLMRAYDANMQLIGDANNPGVVLIPEIIAGMHGGRIAGSAQIRPAGDGVPHYWMELHASGIRAAPVFDDLLLPEGGLEGPPLPGQDAVLSAWSKAEDLSRGSMLADLTLTGPIGEPSMRSGRGTVEIKGGSVLALPGLINLIEVSNLSLPTGANIDLAQADFYVDGPTLAFEQLNASSRKIEILGYGTLNWQSRGVDLRFRSRSVTPIPIVSGLFESLRDELITTRVTGTIDQLDYSVSQFSETRRLINALLGNPPSEQEQQMRQVEQRVLQERNRGRRSTSDVVHQPSDPSESGPAWAEQVEPDESGA
ncbi:MAG: hypothetical protein CMJ35_14995 [Phycisphaerae bacterium]|nr:hypothetical protein [Phycisphaerae bacterium]MBM92895.1 hypothetical protein [Phycisphaerae bacterium]